MNYNSDFKYDLEIGQKYETMLGELLGQTIEVKRDFKALETKNIFVEYESRGKRSGISTTLATYWCYWLSDYHLIIIETDKLNPFDIRNAQGIFTKAEYAVMNSQARRLLGRPQTNEITNNQYI